MWDFSEFFFKSKYILHKNIEKMLFYSILQSKLFSLFCHSVCFTLPSLCQNRSAHVMKTIFHHNIQQHFMCPGGHPSKYCAGQMLLNFGDQTRTSVFNIVCHLADNPS